MSKIVPYNPLDKRNLGTSVADAILQSEPIPLPPNDPFIGAGLYAIYYIGRSFKPYEPIAERNRDGRFCWPIYVGKAVPAGARKGDYGTDTSPGRVLFNRLREHSKSIEAASNLNLEDFCCRFLVVDDIWIPLAESLLISRFAPIWNRTIDGFGNHDPGKGRRAGQRPPWDVLHPGRTWANRLADNSRSENDLTKLVVNSIEAYLKSRDDEREKA
ncbi:Eco29kI restriction endonuclease [Neorhodopirellula pilleata]|uniref:Eco29kI restriction endonuclease n=1 Tax=Neorhodopirellula pilleata TaxID=2714738 RepID=A0A5C6AD15_9BACT|nr:Eco29kI restriction endonuclease [Neorhodopirellula pilleata]